MAIDRVDGKPRKYDMRVVDQFYAYCSAVARANEHREAAAESQHVSKRHLWAALILGSLLCFYFVERVAQAMSLF